MLLMLERVMSGPKRVRALFLSDIHLGTRGCQADRLLDFMRHYEADTVYLVGDIVDGWQLKTSWYWPQTHNDIVQKFLRKARKGACLFYIPGNHDEFLRDYYGTHFGGIEVVEDAIHVGVDGRRYLVIHGDLFDVVIRHARWLALLGNHAYDAAIWLNTYFNATRRALGLTYWSLSQWAKVFAPSGRAGDNRPGRSERAAARARQVQARGLRDTLENSAPLNVARVFALAGALLTVDVMCFVVDDRCDFGFALNGAALNCSSGCRRRCRAPPASRRSCIPPPPRPRCNSYRSRRPDASRSCLHCSSCVPMPDPSVTQRPSSPLASMPLNTAGTHELAGISGLNPSFRPSGYTVYNNKILFNAVDPSGNSGLWITDGTVVGTAFLASACLGRAVDIAGRGREGRPFLSFSAAGCLSPYSRMQFASAKINPLLL
jgi:UDP-2,3-diacylglucosamine pyrophosphatase LpxH